VKPLEEQRKTNQLLQTMIDKLGAANAAAREPLRRGAETTSCFAHVW
jgi:hypothetical protein